MKQPEEQPTKPSALSIVLKVIVAVATVLASAFGISACNF